MSQKRGTQNCAPGSLTACHKRQTSVQIMRVHLSLYILNVTKFQLEHNQDSEGLYKMELKKHNVYTNSAVPFGFILSCNVAICPTYSMFLIFFFLFCFVYGVQKSQGQWVLRNYINIYERKRRGFVTRYRNWTRSGKCKLNQATWIEISTSLCTHIHTSLLRFPCSHQLTLCLINKKTHG